MLFISTCTTNDHHNCDYQLNNIPSQYNLCLKGKLRSGPNRGWKKIHVTIDMSSVTGGLRQNFGAMSSITVGAKISAHDKERNFGT